MSTHHSHAPLSPPCRLIACTRKTILHICLVATATITLSANAATVSIENPWLKVTLDSESGKLQVTERGGGRTVFKEGVLLHAKGVAKVVSVKDETFGTGRAIQSGASTVTLYASLPFALVRATLANDAKEPKALDTVSLLSMTVDLGLPASELKTMGTGGLMEPGKPSGKPAKKAARAFKDDVDLNTDESAADMPSEIPGSYVWAVVAEPQSRRGVITAWLTHDRGSGVVFARAGENGTVLEARSEYGRMRMPSGARIETETLAIGYFDDIRLGLEQWADAVAKAYRIHLRPQVSGYCTWYDMPPHHRAGYESGTAELAEFAGRELKPFGLDFIQIDDGWQVGSRDFSTWNPKGPYKGGMKPTADVIRKNGLIAGLWCIPFVGDGKDPTILAKTADGKPYLARWSGLCLDMTSPAAGDFVRANITRMTKDWGYSYLKLDGFHAGSATPNIYVNAGYKDDRLGESILSQPEKSHIEAFRDGIKLVRATAGPDVFILACAMTQNMRSYGGSFGLVDAMRVGPDNGASWKNWADRSVVYGSRHYFENGRIWFVDPDPAFVREALPIEQARAMCSWTAITGVLFACSDWLPKLPPERLDILKRTLTPHGATARPVDFFELPSPSVWLVTDTRRTTRRDVVALFNWKETPATEGDTFARIGLDPAKEYVAFDFWGDKLMGPFKAKLELELPAKSSLILSMRPTAAYPQVISTSRHVTQGIVDLLEENWSATGKTLSGRSKLVGNDPYELRIVVPSGATPMRGAEISEADRTASVKVESFKQEGNLVRVRLLSPTSREVSWKISF